MQIHLIFHILSLSMRGQVKFFQIVKTHHSWYLFTLALKFKASSVYKTAGDSLKKSLRNMVSYFGMQ